MAAIRSELPVKPLPPVAGVAAPPCSIAFALERVVVLTRYPIAGLISPSLKKGNCVLSSQKEDDPLPNPWQIQCGWSIPQSGVGKQTLYHRGAAVRIAMVEPIFLVIFHATERWRGRRSPESQAMDVE